MYFPRLAATMVAMLSVTSAGAAGKFWVCGDGVWDDGACWSLDYAGAGGAGEPVDPGDTAYLWSDDGLAREITFQTSLPVAPELNLLSIDAVNSGSMTFMQSGYDLLSVDVHIGSIGNGTYSMSGGTLSVTDTLAVANNSKSVGTFDISGTAAVDAAWMILGNIRSPLYDSTGTVNQSDGSVTVANDLTVGNQGTGIYNLGGGTLGTGATRLQTATSSFVQTGGVHTIAGDLTVTAGNYALQDGSLVVGGTLQSGVTGFTQTGGSLVADTIEDGTFMLGSGASLSAATVNGGTFTLNGGAASVGTMSLEGPDSLAVTSGTLDFTTLNLAGGTVSTDLTVPAAGTLNYQSGTLAGRLTNNGNVVSSAADMTIADGLENNAAVSGSGFSFDGAGLANNGSLDFTVSLGGSGPLVNEGQLIGTGIVDGSGGFINNSQFTQGAGDLVIGNTGGNTNNGTLTLAFSRQLSLNQGLANNGLLELNNSLITGPATLTVGSTGTVSGSGNIFAPVDNAGTLQARSGNLVLGGPSLVNTGLLGNAVGSNLFVDAAAVSHSGSVEVNAAGSVVFSSALTNTSGQAVTLRGGVLGVPTLTNAAGGTVSGFGTLSGDMVNAGAVDLFGTSSLVGDLLNQATGHFLVRNDQTLITGHTTNDGTIETLNGNVIFEGGLTNNGALLFDPSVITVTTLDISATGYLAETGAPGDRFIIQEDLVNASTLNTAWQTENTAFQFNGGTHDAGNPQTLEVAGADLGNIFAGWQDNFMFGSLEIGTSDTWLQLVDGADNSSTCLAAGYCEIWSREALYVDDLILHAGVTLDLNGFNLYVRNGFADFGATILGGTVTVGAVPLPPALWLFGSGLLALAGLQRRQ